MKIDNSTIKVGDTVCIKSVTSSWTSEKRTSKILAKVTKITSSRIYVEYNFNLRDKKNTKKLSFEYRKTKRLFVQDSLGMTSYYLFKNEQEFEYIENKINEHKELKLQLDDILKNKVKNMSVEQLKKAIEYFDKNI